MRSSSGSTTTPVFQGDGQATAATLFGYIAMGVMPGVAGGMVDGPRVMDKSIRNHDARNDIRDD